MTNQPLGRGLGSLIPQRPPSPPPVPPAVEPKAPPRISTDVPVAPIPAALPIVAPVETTPPVPTPAPMPVRRALEPATSRHPRQGLYEIPVELVDANPHQPRHHFNQESLDDLVQSIRQHGIIQPLVVTREGERYQLIAGERRLRASKQLGLATVPAVVRDSQELEQLELAIVENVQRQDLNAVEEAYAYQQLADEFGLTQDQIAQKVGKSRTTVANAIRLLSLPTDMLSALREGKITASHGKILLSAVTPSERQQLFQKILDQSLPVRAAGNMGRSTTVRRYTRRKIDPLVLADEDQLRSQFSTKVTISKRDHRGNISFEFYSDEDYRHLLDRLQTL